MRQAMLTPSVQHIFADVLFKIGVGKYLCLGTVNGETVIRLHDLTHLDDRGKPYRFIDLSLHQWISFLAHAHEVLPAAQALTDHAYLQHDREEDGSGMGEGIGQIDIAPDSKIHLGRNVHIVVKPNSMHMHFRQYFLVKEECEDFSVPHSEFRITPTKVGIVISFAEFSKILACIPYVNTILGNPDTTTCAEKHAKGRNGTEYECCDCNPNGFPHWLSMRRQIEADAAKRRQEKLKIEAAELKEHGEEVAVEIPKQRKTQQTRKEEAKVKGEEGGDGGEEEEEEEEDYLLSQGAKKKKRYHKMR